MIVVDSVQRLRGARRWYVAAAAAVALAAIVVWLALPDSGSSSGPTQTVTAGRGNIVVTVSGSGPVSAFGSTVTAAAPAAAAAATGVAAGLPVFPGTTGQLVKLLVAPGQRVRAGQPLAVLADPTAVSGVVQAQVAVQTAQLAMAGAPPSPQELAAGQLGVQLARRKLEALYARPKPAVLDKARVDLANAQAAYESLRHAPASPGAAGVAAARLAITLAQQKLAAVYQPASPGAVLAAQIAVTKAQANLDALVARPPTPELTAAQLALAQAKEQLRLLKSWTPASSLPQPLPADVNAVALSVQQLQARVDLLQAGPAGDVAAAQQELVLAKQKLAALTASSPNASAVAAAQRQLHEANQRLASLTGSATPPDPAALANARQAVAQATQQLSDVVSSPALATLSQAKLDLANAELAYRSLRRASGSPARTALAAAALAVKLSRESLAQLSARPDPTALTQARLDLGNAQVALRTLLARGKPASSSEVVLDQLRLQAARTSLSLAQLHERSLTVRAPIAGTVTGVLARLGSQVDPTAPIATVADLQHLFVTINMSEFDVANVKLGDRASVDVGALGGTSIQGKVVAVAPAGVSNGGVVQFPVTVALRTTPKALRPGMLASVQVVTAERRGVVRVPLEAISVSTGGNNAGQSMVNVLDRSGKQHAKFVDLGLAGPSYVEVIRGVTPGDRLVLPQATVAASAGGGSPSNAPPGIGVPPASQDQGNAGGGGGGG